MLVRDVLRTVILSIHVLCGALWVAVSLSFVLAAGATADGERSAFAARVAPQLNRLNLAAIVLLPLTGIGNIYYVGRAHHFQLPRAFVEVLGVKLLLALGMAIALAKAWATSARVKSGSEDDVRSLIRLYIAMAAMGAAALILGVWLAGSG